MLATFDAILKINEDPISQKRVAKGSHMVEEDKFTGSGGKKKILFFCVQQFAYHISAEKRKQKLTLWNISAFFVNC